MRVTRRPFGVVVLSVALLLAGCETTSNRQAAGAIGGLLGAIAGAAIGGKHGGAVGGAVIGGVTGFLVGSLIGQVLDDADQKRQRAATRAALDGEGEPISWVGHEDPENVRGRTEIVGTRVISPNGDRVQTITEPRAGGRGTVVYCDPGNGKPYRLAANNCPKGASMREISQSEYQAMIAKAPPPATGKTATGTSGGTFAAAPGSTVCRTAREVVWVDGQEHVERNEYCRAAGTSNWVRKAA